MPVQSGGKPKQRLCVLTLLLFFPIAQAAEEDQPVTDLDLAELMQLDVIITATKANMISAQKAPFSIQVVGEEAITQASMQGIDDYSKWVSGMALLNKGPDQTQIMIRGISAGRVSHSEPQNQSTSGLYIDEAPVAYNAFNPDLDLFDVQRIEVLKGPQGTLYGAGAMSGAIRLITKDVDLAASSRTVSVVGAHVTQGDENYSVYGLINEPLIDDVFGVRASAYYKHQGGYIRNVYSGESDYNDYSTQGGRIKALWKVSDQFNISATLLHQDLAADGRPQLFAPNDPNPTASGRLAPGESPALTGDYQTVKFIQDGFNDRFTLGNLLANYEWGTLKFVSSTSYVDRRFENLLDDTYRLRMLSTTQADGVTPLVSPFANDTDASDFAQELRLSQQRDGGLDWVAGLYYQRHEVDLIQSSVSPGLDPLLAEFGIPPSPFFGARPDSKFDGEERHDQRQFAGFGEVTVPLVTRWDFIAGLRWFDYEQDSSIRYAGFVNGGVTSKSSTVSESGTNPKAQLTFRPTEDATLYLQAAKGFRLGGINQPMPSTVVTTECAGDLATLGLTGFPDNFKSDRLWSYELGAKTVWFDRRLAINTAVFHIDWSDIQTNIFLPCGFIAVVNVGKIESEGLEAEVFWAPSTGLSVFVNAAYTDATLSDRTGQFSAQVGDWVPNVPRLSGHAQLQYEWHTAQGGSFFANTSVTYRSDAYSEFQSLPGAIKMRSSTSIDAALGMKFGAWDASLFGRNLTDRLIVTGIDTDRLVPVTYGVAPPRTIGLQLRAQF